jgi:hypothetical protein
MVFFIAAVGGFIGMLVLLSVVALRRQQKAEMAAIDGWDSFGGMKKDVPKSKQPTPALEGGVTESASEVEADEQLTERLPSEEESVEQKPVAGIDLDWDNV